MHNPISSHPTNPRRSAGQPFRAESFEHTHGIASEQEFLPGETNVSMKKELRLTTMLWRALLPLVFES